MIPFAGKAKKPKRRPRPTGIPAATRDLIVADYAAGVPVETIAARYGVCASYPSILARRRAIPRRNKKRTPA